MKVIPSSAAVSACVREAKQASAAAGVEHKVVSMGVAAGAEHEVVSMGERQAHSTRQSGARNCIHG